MTKIAKLTFNKAYEKAVQLWGELAFVEIVPETANINEHKVVGDGKGLTGFGKTWQEAFDDAEKKLQERKNK